MVEGDAGTTPATFTLSLSAASVQAVTIGFTTADGTAVAPFDYLPVSRHDHLPARHHEPGPRRAGRRRRARRGPTRFHLLLGPVVDGVPSVDSVPATIQDDDGGMVSLQELEHGADRREALETAAPDLFVLHEPARTSWEAIVDGASGDLGPGTGPLFERLDAGLWRSCSPRPRWERDPRAVLRWSNASGSPHDGYLRVASDGCTSDCGADDVYRLRAYETTARVPRFNASGQTTVLVLQNVTGSVVAGTAFFWDPAGAVLGSHVFTLPAHATLVLNCSLVPGVAGRSGSITVVHDGGYGGLAGAKPSRWSPARASASIRRSPTARGRREPSQALERTKAGRDRLEDAAQPDPAGVGMRARGVQQELVEGARVDGHGHGLQPQRRRAKLGSAAPGSRPPGRSARPGAAPAGSGTRSWRRGASALRRAARCRRGPPRTRARPPATWAASRNPRAERSARRLGWPLRSASASRSVKRRWRWKPPGVSSSHVSTTSAARAASSTSPRLPFQALTSTRTPGASRVRSASSGCSTTALA